jgi:hypothetical protein
MQLTNAQQAAIVEGPDKDLTAKKYALMVYNVNSSGGGGSGLTGINGVSGELVISELSYSQKIVVSGDYTWVMKTTPGHALADSTWQIMRVYEDSVNGITEVQWADGDSNFDNVANDYLTKVYSY